MTIIEYLKEMTTIEVVIDSNKTTQKIDIAIGDNAIATVEVDTSDVIEITEPSTRDYPGATYFEGDIEILNVVVSSFEDDIVLSDSEIAEVTNVIDSKITLVCG